MFPEPFSGYGNRFFDSLKYNIYFLARNKKKKYIEKDLEFSRVFCRFYNEALFLKDFYKDIKEYQIVFKDVITDEELYKLLRV